MKYLKVLLLFIILKQSIFACFSQQELNKKALKNSIYFYSNMKEAKLYIKDSIIAESLPFLYTKSEYYIKVKTTKEDQEHIIEGNFVKSVIISDGYVAKGGSNYYRKPDKEFNPDIFYITATPKTIKNNNKVELRILDPVINIETGKYLGTTPTKRVKCVAGLALYDPVFGSKNNMVSVISESAKNSYINFVYLVANKDKSGLNSTYNSITIKPIIKHFYFTHFSRDYYYYPTNSKPILNEEYRNVISSELDIEWEFSYKNIVLKRLNTSVAATIRATDPRKAFENNLAQSTLWMAANDSLYQSLVKHAQIIENEEDNSNLYAVKSVFNNKLDLKSMIKAIKPYVVTVHDKPTESFGSGFVINNDGYIVTNFHVIDKSKKTQIQLATDTTLYNAEIVRVNEKLDLALLKIPKTISGFMRLNLTDSLEIGDNVFAIGTPGDPQLSQSVTKGIVSGFRVIDGRDYIQADASINPGNSGGPLVDETGRVVGVVARKISAVGIEGLSFCIPIDIAVKGLRLKIKE